jgi:membrane protease YdiL (CAAX protease family)
MSFSRKLTHWERGSGVVQRRQAQDAYWTYEDIGVFLFIAIALDAVVHLSVRLHLLDSSQLLAPTPALETLITAFLTAALYVILKLHYRKPVVAPLGWLIPSRFYTAISILGGVAAALAITYLTRWRGHVMPTIAAKDFFILGLLLGPILEESVFRGCMLPVLTRTLGNAISVVVIAVLFAAFHAPGDITHWVWLTATGAAYGSLRLASHTTTAAAVMHATCNLTLFLFARL